MSKTLAPEEFGRVTVLCVIFGLAKLSVGWQRVTEADGPSTPPTAIGEEYLTHQGMALGMATHKLLGDKIYVTKTRTPY
jgi:hypothetical protein